MQANIAVKKLFSENTIFLAQCNIRMTLLKAIVPDIFQGVLWRPTIHNV